MRCNSWCYSERSGCEVKNSDAMRNITGSFGLPQDDRYYGK